MWAIRILTGPHTGQIFPVRPGAKQKIGRGSTCEIRLNSDSISKEHMTLLATDDKLLLSDLNSRNGTFVNGIRVQNQRLNIGDKVALHDIMIDVLQVPDSVRFHQGALVPATPPIAQPPAWMGNAAVRLQNQMEQQFDPNVALAPQPVMQSGIGAISPPAAAPPTKDILGHVHSYVDNVAMPGIFAMAQALPYRWAMAMLVAVYVVSITALSIVPIITTTRKNIQAESIRRAKTIAHGMRDSNKRFISEHNDAAVDVHAAELEEGVTAAYIINAKDGTIIAPNSKRGEFANKPFVNQARREEREVAEFIDDTTLGVAAPISFFSPDSGGQAIFAYAIVLYDTGALAMPAGQSFGLFIETLAIMACAGVIFLFFLVKLIEHPLHLINVQVDEALREGRDDVVANYRLKPLEQLVSNINSALSRARDAGNNQSPMNVSVNRDIEAANIIRMMAEPALTISAIDDRILATNPAFDKLVGGGINLVGRSLRDIPDVALQQNLLDLLPKMRAQFGEISLSEIPFSGEVYEICGHPVMGTSEPNYFLVTLNHKAVG